MKAILRIVTFSKKLNNNKPKSLDSEGIDSPKTWQFLKSKNPASVMMRDLSFVPSYSVELLCSWTRA